MVWGRARALVVVAAAACGGGPTVVTPPTRQTAQVAVIALLDDAGAIVSAEVVDAHRDWAVHAEPDGPQRVLVAYYDRSLTELQLGEGPLATAADVACARLAPAEVWIAERTDAPFVRAKLPAALEEALVAGARERCGHCGGFRETRIDIPQRMRRLEGGAPLSDGTVLGLGDPGYLYTISRERVELLTGCPRERYESVVEIAADHFLLGIWDGRLHEVAIDVRDRTCTVVAERTTTATRSLEWLATSPDGREVAAVDIGGYLYRGVDGGPLERIVELPINDKKFSRAGGINRGALVWLGPGELVANGSGAEVVFWKNGRVVRTERVDPLEVGDSVSELAVIGGEVYAGDGGGQVVRLPASGSGPVILADNPLHEIVGSLVPDRDGMFVTTGAGLVATYYPPLGWCEPYGIFGVSDRGRHVFKDKLGDFVLVDMIGNDTNRAQVMWLTPITSPD